MSRKLTELVNAAGLEKSLTKQQILQLYLNRIYLGSGAYGVDGAARVYFGTSARQLTLAQAAMLATLTRAPSVFSPRRDLLRAQQSASLVLDSMVDNGAITEAEAAQARAHPAADRRSHHPGCAQLFPGQRRRRGNPAGDSERRRPQRRHGGSHHLGAQGAGSGAAGDPAHHQQIRQENPHQRSRGGDDEAGWRGQRHDRRRRLPGLGVQPRHPGASPARLGLQALRLSGGAGSRHQPLGNPRR